MDSGNSGSMCSSGEEEYESGVGVHTVGLLNPPTQFGSISHHLQPQSDHYLSSFVSQSPHPSLLHPYNLHHPLSQSQPFSTAHLIAAPGASSSSSSCSSLLVRASADHESLAQCNTDPSGQHHNINDGVGGSSNNGVRNPKKRSRASRRAPTTVLTTDTSNFRSMVQEFTGIPAPPFSPYSRRLSSFVFNPCSLSTTHNLVDANVIPSSSTTNNNLQLLPDMSMHNALFPFHSPLLHVQPSLQDLPVNHNLPHFMTTTTAGISLSTPPPPPTHHHVLTNQDGIAGAGLSSTSTAGGTTSDGLIRAFDFEGTYGPNKASKFNFPPSSSSCSFNHDKALDINTTSNIRGEAGTLDSWICSSD